MARYAAQMKCDECISEGFEKRLFDKVECDITLDHSGNLYNVWKCPEGHTKYVRRRN